MVITRDKTYDSLIAAAGGLAIENNSDVSGVNKAEYGSKSGIPLLRHGDLKISQSGAIERYLADLAPKFAGLTPQQRAVDGMFAALKEVDQYTHTHTTQHFVSYFPLESTYRNIETLSFLPCLLTLLIFF